jgi:hypothetical protein
MGRKKNVLKEKKVREKCCNNCQYMHFNQKNGEPSCEHIDATFGEKENCKCLRHDFSCDKYIEIAGEEQPEDHPVVAVFKTIDDDQGKRLELEELSGKEVDFFLPGGMYTGKLIAYNLNVITIRRTYNNEIMSFPISEVTYKLVKND